MGVRIGLGLAEFPFSEPQRFWRWIELCEETGVDSIWQSDRLTGPEPYLESLVAMAAVASATKRLKFGMNVLSLAFRDPLVVAKQCASIDFLSNGRMLPAFGLGALISPDWKAAGLSPEGQGARYDAALDIIARLWRGERVDADGPHFHYRGRSDPAPLPIQQPLLLHGWAGRAPRRYGARRNTPPAGSAGWRVAGRGGARSCRRSRPRRSRLGVLIDPDHFGIGFFYRLGAAGRSHRRGPPPRHEQGLRRAAI